MKCKVLCTKFHVFILTYDLLVVNRVKDFRCEYVYKVLFNKDRGDDFSSSRFIFGGIFNY